jgi:4-amino-4-deoxychorismate lyase
MSATHGPAAAVWCWVDGEPGEEAPVFDRGLQFGDGLFETFAVVDGSIPRWAAHRDRLGRGLTRLHFDPGLIASLDAEVRHCVARVPGHWVGKLVVTRGSSLRGYRIPGDAAARRILLLTPWSRRPVAHWRDGVTVRLCNLRLGSQPLLAGLKHLNRLEQVLARAEWAGDDPPEGLICDQRGRLVEGTMSNLFLRRGGRILTSPLLECGVAGVMRDWVIDWLDRHSGLELCYESVLPEDLAGVDEIFLTNSLIGAWPVVRIAGPGGHTWSAGASTRALQAALLEAMPWLANGYDGPL